MCNRIEFKQFSFLSFIIPQFNDCSCVSVADLRSRPAYVVVYTGRLFSDSMWDSLGMNPFSPGLPTLNIPEITDPSTFDIGVTTDTVNPRSTLEISRARDLVFTRLSSLQQTLPHRRMDGTLQFVIAIWEEYDSRKADSSSIVHWLDVMREKGLVITLW
mgnify:FL=1|jgi:hypothetical protein